mmetsp:Transcript_2246/g.5203  ORF Transcript_2246/g.5203 Transcript_2246/m.5203 type:complete len:222 (-) Transcript_2246:2023-2688(-)
MRLRSSAAFVYSFISSLGRIRRSTSTSTSRCRCDWARAWYTVSSLRVCVEISLYVDFVSPTLHDALRSVPPALMVLLRTFCMSVTMVSAHSCTVLCEHQADCCCCQCFLSRSGCSSVRWIARAKSPSLEGFTFIVPGITLLHAANSEMTSDPLLAPGHDAQARTYSKGTRERPCRMDELQYMSDMEKSAVRRAKAIFSERRRMQPGNSASSSLARWVTESM